MFKDGLTNVHDEERNDFSYIVSDELVQSVNQKISERQRFIIGEISNQFPQISHNSLYEMITVRLVYRKFCAK